MDAVTTTVAMLCVVALTWLAFMVGGHEFNHTARIFIYVTALSLIAALAGIHWYAWGNSK